MHCTTNFYRGPKKIDHLDSVNIAHICPAECRAIRLNNEAIKYDLYFWSVEMPNGGPSIKGFNTSYDIALANVNAIIKMTYPEYIITSNCEKNESKHNV